MSAPTEAAATAGEWRIHVQCVERDCFHGTSCSHPKIERDVWWGPWRDIDKPRHGASRRPGHMCAVCEGYIDGCTSAFCICICRDVEVPR